MAREHRQFEHATRRTIIKGTLAATAAVAISPLHLAQAEEQAVVNDASMLNPVKVARIAAPRTTDEIRGLVANWDGPVSIGGARYSMGGQIAKEDSLHLDMRSFNRLAWLDVERMTARVQTGMRWRDLQTLIDPYDLSAKIMQSFSNFTIGGALSVNAHGRYVSLGPVINSVRGMQLVLPGGTVLEVSRDQDPELFYGAIGGYGGLGIITEVELDLAPNVRMERRTDRMRVGRYSSFFEKEIRSNPDAIFHNADLDPFGLDEIVPVTWFRTDKPITIKDRLFAIGASYPLEAAEIWALAVLPGAHLLRRNLADSLRYVGQPVVWRNHEASLDVASLGPIATKDHTYALQEYFVPVAEFEEFVAKMSRVFKSYDANVLNVSVRHSLADPGSILRWAPQDVFSFVLYYRQRTSADAQREVGVWTRELIDEALSLGGTYYLPYQLHATQDQFDKAYPVARRFFALKARVDPRRQFGNKLWDKYNQA